MLSKFRSSLDAHLDGPADRRVAVAVSGGGDSLALLSLLKAWADQGGRALIALTVDHGLHPDSAAWTGFAGRAAANLGVAWRPLAWTGAKPSSGLAAAARQARHRLLADAARDSGCRVVTLGHTAEDVFESEVLRRQTPGLGQLRTWSPSPAWPEGRDVFLLRPLLHATRGELRDHLTRIGQTWLEDPANLDPRSARARVRILRATASHEFADPPPDRLRGEVLASLGAHLADIVPSVDGRLRTPRPLLRRLDRPTARRLVGVLALCAAGGSRPPKRDKLDRLVDQLASDQTLTVSLAGARITAAQGQLEFAREAGERARGGLAEVALQPGRTMVFDGRFEAATLDGTPAGLSLAPLAGRISQLKPEDAAAVRRFPASARAALPVVIGFSARPALPQPFGNAPVRVRELSSRRLAAACGLMARESDIDDAEVLMAPSPCSPYVDG